MVQAVPLTQEEAHGEAHASDEKQFYGSLGQKVINDIVPADAQRDHDGEKQRESDQSIEQGIRSGCVRSTSISRSTRRFIRLFRMPAAQPC